MVSFRLLAVLVVAAAAGAPLLHQATDVPDATIYLDSSVPYIGADIPREAGYSGDGVIIAIIDTGIDSTHPDLAGLDIDGRLQGRNFVDPGASPTDVNGHGTQVAGVIAADGSLQGVAPEVTIYSYKVSHDGNSVSSDLIIRAIRQAVEDGADIINISLGVNRTNANIDAAVNDAAEAGIVVIVAAGNDGPGPRTIGSPGINPNAITVGATYNNLTSSLAATLRIQGETFQVIPMAGTKHLDLPITAPLASGGYGRTGDLDRESVEGTIAVVERGSDVPGETIYFSDKEFNAANAGALALLVYNNADGIFLGELLHEFTAPDYAPRIPVLSISGEDGRRIERMIADGAEATLHVFINPDFVVHFSSRGPVSPFFAKPDMVAPGVFVNSTFLGGGYNYTSGTSFATPHVSGTAALLLERYPDLTPTEVKSIIVTTTDPILDESGGAFPIGVAGSGRLNTTKALGAEMVVSPTLLTFDVSRAMPANSEEITLGFPGAAGDVRVRVEGPDAFEIDHEIAGNSVAVAVRMVREVTGEFVGRLFLSHGTVEYNVPLIIRSSEATVTASNDAGTLRFEIDAPGWSFAKIYATNSESGLWHTASATPERGGTITVYEPGTYWVEARISTGDQRYDAYGKVHVESPAQRSIVDSLGIDLPYRQVVILAGVTAAVALVGVLFSRYRQESLRA